MSETCSGKVILVTGATGFVGTALCERIVNIGCTIRRVLRRDPGPGDVLISELAPDTNWSEALSNVDCAVHLAGIVHIPEGHQSIAIGDYHRVNVDATLNFARQAEEQGVRRFIFISTIKVNGEFSELGKPFSADSPVRPTGAYATTKWEAEQALLALASDSDMEVVIIRPPLVYGPGVKANFENMMRWISRGLPLPFGAIRNKRSLVGLDNLVDLIVTCIDHPAAANQIFLVSDGEDLSTTELLQRTAAALGEKVKLLKMPQSILEYGLNILGKKNVAQRLCESLQVDIGKTRELLDWSPPVNVDEGLSRTAAAYKLSLNE